MNRFLATWLLLFAVFAPIARAWENAASPAGTAEVQQRWERLSETQKNRLRENYDKWKAMPPERQRALRENFDKFRGMGGEERQQIVKRFQLFRSLPPERQQRVRDRFQKFMQLPREERQQRMEKLRHFRDGRRGSDGGGGLMRGRDGDKKRDKLRDGGPRDRDNGPRPFRQGEGGRRHPGKGGGDGPPRP